MIKVPTSPNNPEIDLLSNNRFIDYLVLIFAKKKKSMNQLINIKNLHTKMNMIIYIEMIK